MRTALFVQVLMVISPPKLLTSRRAPARTGTVVSVCCASIRPASDARVMSMLVYPLSGPRAGEGRCLPQQVKFAPHLLCEMEIQVCIPGVGRKGTLGVPDRPVDDPQILLDHAHRRGVERGATLCQHPLQVRHRGG